MSQVPGHLDRKHTDAFDRLMASFGFSVGDAQKAVSNVEPQSADVMEVTDQELLVLRRVATTDVGVDAEINRRVAAALLDFKQESAKASGRLETLTEALIVFAAALVLLSVALVTHDLGR